MSTSASSSFPQEHQASAPTIVLSNSQFAGHMFYCETFPTDAHLEKLDVALIVMSGPCSHMCSPYLMPTCVVPSLGYFYYKDWVVFNQVARQIAACLMTGSSVVICPAYPEEIKGCQLLCAAINAKLSGSQPKQTLKSIQAWDGYFISKQDKVYQGEVLEHTIINIVRIENHEISIWT